jgi:hypothetical protein
MVAQRAWRRHVSPTYTLDEIMVKCVWVEYNVINGTTNGEGVQRLESAQDDDHEVEQSICFAQNFSFLSS